MNRTTPQPAPGADQDTPPVAPPAPTPEEVAAQTQAREQADAARQAREDAARQSEGDPDAALEEGLAGNSTETANPNAKTTAELTREGTEESRAEVARRADLIRGVETESPSSQEYIRRVNAGTESRTFAEFSAEAGNDDISIMTQQAGSQNMFTRLLASVRSFIASLRGLWGGESSTEQSHGEEQAAAIEDQLETAQEEQAEAANNAKVEELAGRDWPATRIQVGDEVVNLADKNTPEARRSFLTENGEYLDLTALTAFERLITNNMDAPEGSGEPRRIAFMARMGLDMSTLMTVLSGDNIDKVRANSTVVDFQSDPIVECDPRKEGQEAQLVQLVNGSKTPQQVLAMRGEATRTANSNELERQKTENLAHLDQLIASRPDLARIRELFKGGTPEQQAIMLEVFSQRGAFSGADSMAGAYIEFPADGQIQLDPKGIGNTTVYDIDQIRNPRPTESFMAKMTTIQRNLAGSGTQTRQARRGNGSGRSIRYNGRTYRES